MSTNPLSSPTSPAGGARAPRTAQVDPIRLFRDHRWLFSGTFVLSILVGIVLFVVLLFFSPRYTSEVLLRVTGGITDPYQGVGNSNQLGAQTRMDLLDAYIKNQTVRIRSDDIINEVLTRDTVRNTRWFAQFANNVVDAREDLQEDLLSVGQIRGSTLISVKLSGPFKEEMVVILEEVVEEYLRKMRIETGQESDKVRMTFVRERTEAERDLTRAREEMEQFASQYNLTNLEARGSEALVTFQLLTDQMTKLQMAMEEARAGYTGLSEAQQSGQITSTPAERAEVDLDRAVSARNERLMFLREQREVMVHRFGENHRAVIDLDHQYRATEQERDREIDRLLRERQEIRLEQSRKLMQALEGQIVGLQPKLDEARERVSDLNRNLERYRQIQARAEAADERRARAEESLTRARLQSERPDSIRVQRVTPATEAELTFPRPHFVVPGVVVLMTGLVAGVLFLREMFDQRVKSPADLKLLPNCKVLGVLPHASDDPSGSGKIENAVVNEPTGLFAEAFRGIRTAMLAQIDRQGFRTLMIVGVQARCGASSVASNLACSFAAKGMKVLLVDANFRRPSQHDLFDVDAKPGLSDVVKGTVAVTKAIVHAGELGVDLLTVGDKDSVSAEMLEGASFKQLLGTLEKQYDLVLIDVAPALLTSEARQLAKQVDAIALVVRAMSDMRGMVGRVMQQLENQRAQLLGIVLNGVKSSAGGYFKRNYEEFYKYHRAAEGERLAESHSRNGSPRRGGHRATREQADAAAAAMEAARLSADDE